MEHERLETTVRWRTTTLSLAWRKPNQVEAMDASTPPKVHQSIPRSIWFLACRGRAVLIFIGWALLSCHPFVCVRQAGIIPTFSAPTIECLFVCIKGLKWPRIVVLSSVHESAKVWTIIRPRLFLVDRVSNGSRSPLTSADCYCCPSLYCLVWVFQNLPAPHKHYGVFDVFADFQSFSNLKTWGSHLAMSTDDRFLPQGSATHTLDRVAYV